MGVTSLKPPLITNFSKPKASPGNARQPALDLRGGDVKLLFSWGNRFTQIGGFLLLSPCSLFARFSFFKLIQDVRIKKADQLTREVA